MVHAIFLASQFRLVLSESQRVRRSVYLRNDFHVILFCQLLQVDELLLRVRSILCRKTRIRVAFQAESRLRLVPIIVEVLHETVIVKMNLQRVHLVISHYLGKAAQIIHGDKLTSAVHHEPSKLILWHIDYRSLRQSTVGTLLRHLQQRTCSPENTLSRRSLNVHRASDANFISFFSQRIILDRAYHYVARLRLPVCYCQCLAEHLLIIALQCLRYLLQRFVLYYYIAR